MDTTPDPAGRPPIGPSHRFKTTRWSMVTLAGSQEPAARRAFAQLCETYWHPLYAYLRRKGTTAVDTEDAIQSFFTWIMEKDIVERADPERGRFRTFLIRSLDQFIQRSHRYERAQKRTPHNPPISLNGEEGERQYQMEPGHSMTPERLYEYTWAISTVRLALARLASECEQSAKGNHFRLLRGFLTGERTVSGRQAADELGISEIAVRAMVHRFKKRYGEILRDEVSQTLQHTDDVDQELRQLMSALQPT